MAVFGATSSIDYNTAGLPAVLTDPLGAPTRFDYDQVSVRETMRP
jgi:uncharacterized protein RhaS with RHS repeats